MPILILIRISSQFAQELLSTFSTDLGEVALVPKTGGVFTVTIWHGTMKDGEITMQESVLWDRKRDGGFPGMFSFSFLLLVLFLFFLRFITTYYSTLYTA